MDSGTEVKEPVEENKLDAKISREISLSEHLIPVERTLASVVPASNYMPNGHHYINSKANLEDTPLCQVDTSKALPVICNPDKFRVNVESCKKMLEVEYDKQ